MKSYIASILAASMAFIAGAFYMGCQPLTPPQQQTVTTVAQLPADTAVTLRTAATQLAATQPTSKVADTLNKAAAAIEKAAPVTQAVANASTQPGASPATIIFTGAQAGADAAASGLFGPTGVGIGIIAGLILRLVQAQVHQKQNETTPAQPTVAK